VTSVVQSATCVNESVLNAGIETADPNGGCKHLPSKYSVKNGLHDQQIA
jgi:hypothetical protein